MHIVKQIKEIYNFLILICTNDHFHLSKLEQENGTLRKNEKRNEEHKKRVLLRGKDNCRTSEPKQEFIQ